MLYTRTQTVIHTHTQHAHTKTLSHTDADAFYTQALLHKHPLWHTKLDTQTKLNTETLYTQKFKPQSWRNRRLPQLLMNRRSKIAILHQFLPIEPHFVRKGCNRHSKIAILLQFLTIEPHFVRKGCDRTVRSPIYLSFFRWNLISCERVAFRGASLALPRALREK